MVGVVDSYPSIDFFVVAIGVESSGVGTLGGKQETVFALADDE